MKKAKRIGLMGGTFDPIHFGHLVTAESARFKYNLDKVVFVPSGNPPHKKERIISPANHRMEMTLLATVTNPFFSISDIEVARPGYSYAYDTVCAFHEQFGEDIELFFITGADAMTEILTWKEVDKLMQKCSFIAATRPGFGLEMTETFPPEYWQRISIMEIPALAISSSDIRKRCAEGDSIKYLLPETVETYIYKYGLYTLCGDTEGDMLMPCYNIEQLKERLLPLLSGKRYLHSLAVMQLAAELAVHWGEDEPSAVVAGLLHDVAKEYPHDKLLSYAAEMGMELLPIYGMSPGLLHGPVGAYVLENEWGIKDVKILSAVSRHTVAVCGMSDFEKIIALADLCAEGRQYKGVEEIRRLCYTDLNEAMAAAIERKMYYTIAAGKSLFPEIEEVCNYYKNIKLKSN